MVSSLGGNFLLTVFPVSSLGQGRTEKGLLLNERCEKCKTATVSPAISKKQIFQVDLRVILYSTVVFLVFFTPKSIFSLRLDSIFFFSSQIFVHWCKICGRRRQITQHSLWTVPTDMKTMSRVTQLVFFTASLHLRFKMFEMLQNLKPLCLILLTSVNLKWLWSILIHVVLSKSS